MPNLREELKIRKIVQLMVDARSKRKKYQWQSHLSPKILPLEYMMVGETRSKKNC